MLALISKIYGKGNIKILYVKSHTEMKDYYSLGNERADYLAKQALKLNLKESLIPLCSPDNYGNYITIKDVYCLNDIKKDTNKINKVIRKINIKKLNQQSEIMKFDHLNKIQEKMKDYGIKNNGKLYSFWLLASIKWLIVPPFKKCVLCKKGNLYTEHLLKCDKLKNEIDNIKDILIGELKNMNIQIKRDHKSLVDKNYYFFLCGIIPKCIEKLSKKQNPLNYKEDLDHIRLVAVNLFYNHFIESVKRCSETNNSDVKVEDREFKTPLLNYKVRKERNSNDSSSYQRVGITKEKKKRKRKKFDMNFKDSLKNKKKIK